MKVTLETAKRGEGRIVYNSTTGQYYVKSYMSKDSDLSDMIDCHLHLTVCVPVEDGNYVLTMEGDYYVKAQIFNSKNKYNVILASSVDFDNKKVAYLSDNLIAHYLLLENMKKIK